MIKKKLSNYQRSNRKIRKIKLFRGEATVKKRFIKEKFKLCNIPNMEKYVLYTQFKLATAIRQNKSDLIETIVMELLNSYEAKCYAVYKTIKSSSYKSLGVSDKRTKTNIDYGNLVDKLGKIIRNPDTYRVSPLRRIYTKKFNEGKKPLFIPTYLDRALQTLYSFALLPYGEYQADQFSYGGRPLRSPAYAAKVILLLGNQTKSNTRIPFYVLNADIVKCLDNISNEWVINNVPIIHRSIIYEWLKYGFIDILGKDNKLNPTVGGVPQGGVISPIICNIVLNGIQKFVEKTVKNQLGQNTRCHLIRFLDDIVVLCDKLEAAKLAMQAIEIFINERKLNLNKEKTRIVDLSCISQSYTFVGIQFSYKLIHGKYKLKLSVPCNRVMSIKRRILLQCKNAKTPYEIIKQSNSLIIGWSNYYKICNNKYVFRKLSYWLLKTIGRALYLLYIKSSFENGKFGIRKGKRSGRLRRKIAAQVVKRIHFLKAKHRLIYDFNKLKNNSKRSRIVVSKTENRKVELYLPIYQEMRDQRTISGKDYFNLLDHIELREIAFQNESSTRSLLLRKYKGYCPICSRDLMNCRYEIYHIKPIVLNSNNKLSNLIPLCIYCHYQITTAVKNGNRKSMNTLNLYY